ncbi:acyltransferase family protein [Halobacillus amylolyticus]|uniref:Acyltransferase n=1 Tax=Halobacillus amylolyticus TaxID=2932259 RepID=A0ABY4HFT1_9BACI|nr:acyltransferase [Halobacillus amylolyticus]UOR13780.1 acyltransferase [Halobacillus amylolyticus]
MEFSKNDIKILQGVAILMMLSLHLFARKEVNGLYETFPTIDGIPLIYYLGLFGDACVPIYLFASGYGLYISLSKLRNSPKRKNAIRIIKLLVNFWIILFMFMAIGFLVGRSDAFSGGVVQFLLNFSLLSNSYNGVWWYLQTYTILILLTPFIFKLIKKYNPLTIVFISVVIYLTTYIQRIKGVIDVGDHGVVIILVNALVLLGTSQFAFVVGAVFAKDRIYSKLHSMFHSIKLKNILCLVGIVALVIIHSLYESMVIAPLTAISFICLFSLMDKSILIRKVLTYFGNHSTNLWLTHMFFYMTIFPEFTFAPRYPVLIFIWLLILCLCSSYIINWINNPIQQKIDKSASTIRKKYTVLEQKQVNL